MMDETGESFLNLFLQEINFSQGYYLVECLGTFGIRKWSKWKIRTKAKMKKNKEHPKKVIAGSNKTSYIINFKLRPFFDLYPPDYSIDFIL